MLSINRLIDDTPYNNLTLSQLADEDIDELLVLWYEKHIKRGGATDFYFERILGSNIGSQDFETEIQWNIVQAPPHHEKIKALRKHTGMSMRGSASLIGISGRKMIRGYERGERAPNDQTWTLWLLLTGQHPEVEVIKR